MPFSLTNRLLGISLLIAAMIFAIQNHRLATAQRHASELALHVSNLEAAHSTTRELHALSTDSARTFARRVVQVAQPSDATDRALASDRAASYAMKLRVDTIYIQSSESQRDSLGSIHFDLRQPPFTVAADLTAHADTSALRLSIALDTIPLTARIECSKPGAHGIRAASLLVTTPKWASMHLDHVEQAPNVCGVPTVRAGETRHLALAPLMVGVGRLYGPGGGQWGAFIGAGILVR